MPEVLELFRNSLDGSSPAWLFFLFFFGTFVSEDAACLLAGTAVANGTASWELAISSCLLGIFTGDMLLYGIGRFGGKPLFENRFVRRFVSTSKIEKAAAWLERNAVSAIFVSRFISGLRLPTYVLAGVVRADLKRFAFFFFIAAAVWTPLLVGSAAFAQRFVFPNSAVVGIVLTAIILHLLLKFSSWKNRRLFIGRIERIVNWEFWPMPVFYFPVACYVTWKCLRCRDLAFTATNPAIESSGFVGESKYRIYQRLERSNASAGHLLAYSQFPFEQSPNHRLISAREFVDSNSLEFPLILKPDVGERGKGVAIIHDQAQLESELITQTGDMILQEYAPGIEASVFYYRYPNEANGEIFSITAKEFPVVTGNGITNLETLILSDSRAVAIADKYFERNRGKLNYIPASGERFQLVDIGTHSRGAIFKDGEHLFTEILEKRIDEICRGIEGFYFGRFDLRARSFDDLRNGEFKIIELNGVSSESTNIYDPKFSLFDAYRILFHQWKIAIEIGKRNFENGARSMSLLDLIRLILNVPGAKSSLPPSELSGRTATIS